MNDLISRQAAIDAVISLCDDCDSGYCGSCRVNYPGEKDARKALEGLPSAQPERKNGNWVGIDDDPCETFECDRCGFVLDDWIQGALYNFCPNCGADMRGGDENVEAR